MELEPGIDYWAATGKYRVRINRKRVTYKVGLYEKLEDAIKAKHDFLAQYELNSDDSDAVPMDSKEWFKRERQKQVATFTSSYASGQPNKPKQVMVIDRWWKTPSTENLLLIQRIENDT